MESGDNSMRKNKLSLEDYKQQNRQRAALMTVS